MSQFHFDPSREDDPWSLPDSDPFGPFSTETEAIEDARNY